MKITVFNASPRAERGNTHRMVAEFLQGAGEAGAETENIFLAQKDIHECTGCFSCWVKTPGECVVKDDMREMLAKYIASDIVVFAGPVYVGNVTAIMKRFLDRIIPIVDPHLEKNKDGFYRHVRRYKKYPKMVLISNCGFPEQVHFKYYRSVFKYLEFMDDQANAIIGEIYRGEGEILGNKSILLKPALDKYRALLRNSGREIVKDQKLSDETRAELEKPIIPYDKYAVEANKSWDRMRIS